MTKPILWLGPLEDLDADYDPLLGRSAIEAPQRPDPTLSIPMLEGRSVFDDPIEDNVATLPLPSDSSGIASPSGPRDAAQPVSEDTPPVFISNPAKIEVPTDYTHNNEPILARQGAGLDDANRAVPRILTQAALQEKRLATKKSLFAQMFSQSTIEPSVKAPVGRSINDIWAKTETADDLPFLPVERETIAQRRFNTEDCTIDDVALVPDSDGLNSDKQADIDPVQAKADEVHTLDTDDAQPDQEPNTIPESSVEVSSVEASLVDELSFEEPAPKDVADEDLEVDETHTLPVSAATEIDTPLQRDDVPNFGPDSCLDSGPVTSQNSGQAIAAKPGNFNAAFDADKFWSVPKSGKANLGKRAPIEADQDDPPGLADQSPAVGEGEHGEQPLPARELVEQSFEDVPQKSDAPTNRATQETAPVPAQEPELQPADQKLPPSPVAGVEIIGLETPLPQAYPRPSGTRSRPKKKVKKNYVGTFFGTFLIGVAAIMTAVSTAAPIGYPFDMLSSYRWYWVTFAVIAAAIWGVSRGWKMVVVSFAVILANLVVTIPATGKAPVGGKTATAVIGWANVGGSAAALSRVFADADKKQASLVMVANAPNSVFTPPAGWTLVEAPIEGDATAIAVLSKSNWRAVTVPGEPTMARPVAGDLTVIGVHPLDAMENRRSSPARLALINRTATRAGSQIGATVVFGDFNAPPWDRAIGQLRSVGAVTRVRCGGWTGSTLTTALGFIGKASDHAFVRDVRVTHCQLGATLPGSPHKPIWLFVAPQVQPSTPDRGQ